MKSIGTASVAALVSLCSLGHRAVAWTTPPTATTVACGRASGSLPWCRQQSRLLHKRNKFAAGDNCLRARTSTSASCSKSHTIVVPPSIVLSPAGDWSRRGQPRSLRRQLSAGRRQSLLYATTSTAAAGVESEDDGRVEIAGACASWVASLLQRLRCSAAAQQLPRRPLQHSRQRAVQLAGRARCWILKSASAFA